VNGHILVKPAWSQYERVWNLEQGGGPGIFMRMELARTLQHWLNAAYGAGALERGLERIAQYDRNLAEADKADLREADLKRRRALHKHDPERCPICRALAVDNALAEIE